MRSMKFRFKAIHVLYVYLLTYLPLSFYLLHSCLLSPTDNGQDFYSLHRDRGLDSRPQTVYISYNQVNKPSIRNRSLFVRESRHFDVCVPQQGEHERLLLLANQLANAWVEFQQSEDANFNYILSLRLLVLWSSADQGVFANAIDEEKYKVQVRQAMFLPDFSANVEFVYYNKSDTVSNKGKMPEEIFSRSLARNILQNAACHQEECFVANVDVDMSIGPVFFQNTLQSVHSGRTVYFPIVWSQYSPSSTQTIRTLTHNTTFGNFSKHVGYWRLTGYGMSVMSGSDAKLLQYDTKFVGWGGEDKDFYRRVESQREIVRHIEYGLVHIWHPKTCIAGLTVSREKWHSCKKAVDALDSSPFVQQLDAMQDEDIELFTDFMTPSGTKPSVLIAVSTSRKELGRRVATIAKTWGHRAQFSEGVTIRYFVGKNLEDTLLDTAEDISILMNQANLTDPSSIIILDGDDNEYPPVRKRFLMLKKCREILQSLEYEKGHEINWVFKVDDDTFVNVARMQNFLVKYDANTNYFFGQRGHMLDGDYGKLKLSGLNGPFCMGGPGFILSRTLLKALTPNKLDMCMDTIEKSQYRDSLWHSDVAVGFCVQKVANISCWNSGSYSGSRVFKQYYKSGYVPDFVNPSSISTHAVKDPNDMLRLQDSLSRLEFIMEECGSKTCVNQMMHTIIVWPEHSCNEGEIDYKERYPEVSQLVESGEYESYYNHYKRHRSENKIYICPFDYKELVQCCNDPQTLQASIEAPIQYDNNETEYKLKYTLTLNNLFLLCDTTFCINEVVQEYENWPIYSTTHGEKYYRKYYKDVNASIESGKYTSGYEHYIKEGYYVGNEYDYPFLLQHRLKRCCQRYVDTT